MEENGIPPVVILDNGSGYLKAGFSNQKTPEVSIPALVGRQLLRYGEKIEMKLLEGDDGPKYKEINSLKEELNNIDITDLKINSKKIFYIKEFEKDDDKNGHIVFIFAASNLRAQNFKIPNEDIIKVKFIAGKIIPAIASTTASIVGLVSLQLYTLCQKYNINSLRDCKFDLANNYFEFSCPIVLPKKPEKKEIFGGFKDFKSKLSDIFKEIFKF